MSSIPQRLSALGSVIALHLEFHWAELQGDHFRALKIMELISMADFSALSAGVDRAAALHASDLAALEAAQAADASIQPTIDALTAKINAFAPPAPEQGEQAGDAQQ